MEVPTTRPPRRHRPGSLHGHSLEVCERPSCGVYARFPGACNKVSESDGESDAADVDVVHSSEGGHLAGAGPMPSAIPRNRSCGRPVLSRSSRTAEQIAPSTGTAMWCS
jgi:hypothetical protein